MLHHTLIATIPETTFKPLASFIRSVTKSSCNVALREAVSTKEEWARRNALRTLKIQRFETIKPKLYYAPEWNLDENPDKDEGKPNPLLKYGTTPEKWEYYNKVVWTPNFVVPETGLVKRREVYHCKQSVHCSPKKMWKVCHLVRRRNVDDALLQLQYAVYSKAADVMQEVLNEAKKRAEEEFCVEFPCEMNVAEAFAIQCNIVKSSRRHAHEMWHEIRHRYINIFVRLEEGEGPGLPEETKRESGWERMLEYYHYLRSRSIKYSI